MSKESVLFLDNFFFRLLRLDSHFIEAYEGRKLSDIPKEEEEHVSFSLFYSSLSSKAEASFGCHYKSKGLE